MNSLTFSTSEEILDSAIVTTVNIIISIVIGTASARTDCKFML